MNTPLATGNDIIDKLIWAKSSNGIFSVKFAYTFMKNDENIRADWD